MELVGHQIISYELVGLPTLTHPLTPRSSRWPTSAGNPLVPPWYRHRRCHEGVLNTWRRLRARQLLDGSLLTRGPPLLQSSLEPPSAPQLFLLPLFRQRPELRRHTPLPYPPQQSCLQPPSLLKFPQPRPARRRHPLLQPFQAALRATALSYAAFSSADASKGGEPGEDRSSSYTAIAPRSETFCQRGYMHRHQIFRWAR